MNDVKKNEFNATVAPSSEAEFVAHYLKENKIKFIQEWPIVELSGSPVNYRKADFFLPRLKVYVEYFGLYNKSKADRIRYDEVAKDYIRNSIPTIFIYPHELGFLDYAFVTKLNRLRKVEKFKLVWPIFKYRLVRYFNTPRASSLVWLLVTGYIFLILASVETGLTEDFLMELALFDFLFFIAALVTTFKDMLKIIVKGS